MKRIFQIFLLLLLLLLAYFFFRDVLREKLRQNILKKNVEIANISENRNVGIVVKVKDGDTIVVRRKDGEKITCRLYGIDAPETKKGKRAGQPYGQEAYKKLKDLIFEKEVSSEKKGKDRYGRDVCVIYSNSRDINLEMVKSGYAWAYKEYLKGPYASEYLSAEEAARKNKLGLWQEPNPMPPWEFRKRRINR